MASPSTVPYRTYVVSESSMDTESTVERVVCVLEVLL
jgi:hypothetical protein